MNKNHGRVAYHATLPKGEIEMYDFYNIITEKIIAQLENGIIPWKRPWTGTPDGAYSRYTGKPYSLMNQLLLGKPGEWMTFKQIQDLGGKVKKGEKSSMVFFWNLVPYKNTAEDNEDGVYLTYPVLKRYNVFHIDQTEGIEPLSSDEKHQILIPCQDAEEIMANYVACSGVSMIITPSNEAYYRRKSDTITIPVMEQYSDVSEYYSTAFHEMIHSTGHESRLNRLKNASFTHNTNDYAKEELVAEIGAAALCHQSNIATPESFENSVAYIQSWLNALKNDKSLIVKASSQAEKAINYIKNNEITGGN